MKLSDSDKQLLVSIKQPTKISIFNLLLTNKQPIKQITLDQ